MSDKKLLIKLAADVEALKNGLRNASRQLTTFEKSVVGVGKTLGAYFGAYQIYRGLEYGVRTLASFERQMDTVQAVTGATGIQFQKLEENALKLGRSTEYTATQVGKLQTEYGRLGFSTNEILNSTQATLNLATATGEDLARSAEIAGSTLRGFGLDAINMVHVTDVMASSFNKSALALDSFADAIKYVSPVAKAVNVSLEETTAMLGVLADAGIKGSQAGTSLRRIFTLLTSDGRPLADRLDELSKKGITLADANDEVGLYAQTALLVLAREKEKVDELTKSLQNSNGETQKMADIMRDNLIGDWDKFTSAIEGALQTGNGLVEVLRDIVQQLTKIANTDLSDVSRNIMFFAELFGISDAWSKARDKAAFIGPLPAENEKLDWGFLPNPPKDPEEPQEPSIRSQSLAALADFNIPATVFQLAEYESALLRALAAQEQFQASAVNMSDKAGVAFAKTSEHLAKITKGADLEIMRGQMELTALTAEQTAMRMVSSMMAIGDAIGDALVNSIRSGESFVQALVGQIDQAIQQLYRLAVAYFLTDAFKKSGGNPLVAVGLATAGMIAARVAFASIGKNSGQMGNMRGDGGLERWRRQDKGNQQYEFLLKGSNLVAVMANENRRTGRSKP